jgi:hypothetical protein
VFEETGLRVSAAQVLGPVHEDVAEFGFAQFWFVQRQQYFVVRAPAGWQPSPGALDGEEAAIVDAWAWWTRAQVRACAAGDPHDGPGAPGELVYPSTLTDLLTAATTV